MTFVPISINNYVKKHLKNNPYENEKELRKRLQNALDAYNRGERCGCGNDIWVIGSAFAGLSCFTCITGESFPDNDYEIDTAIKKRESTKGRRHIAEMDPHNIAGIFDDDGYEIKPEMSKKPSLCLTCAKNVDFSEDYLCDMTRYDQQDEEEFKCFAYEARST